MRQGERRRGRQYHLGVGPGDVAPHVILVGDPARAEVVAGRFEKRRGEWRHREFVTISGAYHGLELTVTGTGIGPDNMEIAVIELYAVPKGSDPDPRGLLWRLAARRAPRGSRGLHRGRPAGEYDELLRARGLSGRGQLRGDTGAREACRQARARYHVGITASAPGFYGAQSRHVPGFPPRFADLPGELGRLGVLNFEMEVSSLFTLASLGATARARCARCMPSAPAVFLPMPAKGSKARHVRSRWAWGRSRAWPGASQRRADRVSRRRRAFGGARLWLRPALPPGEGAGRASRRPERRTVSRASTTPVSSGWSLASSSSSSRVAAARRISSNPKVAEEPVRR
jgi:uridine phosphorylase